MAGRSYLKTEARTENLPDCISNAYGDIQSLAEEMGELRDNLEEKFSHTNKYQMASDAADTLDGQEEPDTEANISDVQVSFGETVNKNKKRGISRATRLDNSISRLNACVEALQSAIDELEEKEEEKEGTKDDVEGVEALTELRDALQTTIDNLDGAVEFPGMYAG